MEVNGEAVTGIALILLSILFLFAGTINDVWSILIPADFLILAIGIGFLSLGVITLRRKKRHQIA